MFAARVLHHYKRLLSIWIRLRHGAQAVHWPEVRAPLVDDDVVLQSPTHLWLRDLSRAVHPTQLCRHHPRVANRIACAWHDPKRADRLLSDLMVDRRGTRRGFPPRIMAEIDRLYRYNAGRINPMLRRRSPPDLKLVPSSRLTAMPDLPPAAMHSTQSHGAQRSH